MKQFFCPISKINKTTREVHGILALEGKDKEGEIMDYEDSKPFFQSWSKGISVASGGKSVGNLRVMHQPIIGGKFTAISFDDEKKQIPVIAKVSNDKAWKQILEGELNGFSIYGDPVYRKRDKVNKAIRYAVKPLEGSLVDNPCMYGADFTLIKENGEEIVAKFAGDKGPYQFWHCRHDCDLLHKTKIEADACNGVIAKSANSDFLDEDTDNNDKISKNMYDVSSLAQSVAGLKWLDVQDELKPKFVKAVTGLLSVLMGMVKTESSDFKKTLDDLEIATATVKSVGIQIIKGEDMKLKVKKAAAASDNDDDLEVDFDEVEFEKKITKSVVKSVAKSVGTVVRDILDEAMEEMSESMTALSDAVQKMSGLPKRTKVVSKSTDRKKAKKDSEDDDDEDNEKNKKVEKKAKKTSDIDDEELHKIMKTALRRPINVKESDEEENDDEDNDDDENDE